MFKEYERFRSFLSLLADGKKKWLKIPSLILIILSLFGLSSDVSFTSEIPSPIPKRGIVSSFADRVRELRIIFEENIKTWQKISDDPFFPFAVSKDGKFIFASGSEGIYRSADNGSSWEKITKSIGTYSATDISIYAARVNPKTGYIFIGTDKGIFKSIDNGDNWVEVSSSFRKVPFTNLAINPSNGYIFAFTPGKILMSPDNGTTWTKVNSDFQYNLSNGYLPSVLINPKSGSIFVLVSNPNRLLRSEDNGRTWKPVFFYEEVTINTPTLAVDPRNGYIYTDYWRSKDDGNTWESFGRLISSPILYLEVNPKNGDIYAAVKQSVFKSTDNGDTWKEIGVGLFDVNEFKKYGEYLNEKLFYSLTYFPYGPDSFYYIFFDPRTNYIFVSTREGLYRTMDKGDYWLEISNNFNDNLILSLAINPLNRDLFVVTLNGLYRSTDRGENWTKVDSQIEIFYLLINPKDGALIGGNDKGIFRSTDNGKSWSQIFSYNYSKGSPSEISEEVFTFEIDPVTGDIYVITTKKILKSNSRGEKWETWAILDSMKLDWREIAINPRNNSIFVEVYRGDITKLEEGGLYRSTDRGKTWKKIESKLPGISRIEISPINNYIYAITCSLAPESDLYRSVDNGNTWTKIISDTGSFAINPKTGNIFISLANIGETEKLFKSTDSGNTLKELSNWGIEGFFLGPIVIDPQEEYIYIVRSLGDRNKLFKLKLRDK